MIEDAGQYPTGPTDVLRQASPERAFGAAGVLGSLERKAYKEDWLEASRFRRGVRAATSDRVLGEQLTEQEHAPAAEVEREGIGKPGGGFGALRAAASRSALDDEDADDAEGVVDRAGPPHPRYPVTPARVAARLILARLFDAQPNLRDALRCDSPVVVIDVPDPDMLDRVVDTWQETILDDSARVHQVHDAFGRRGDADVLLIVAKEPSKGKAAAEREGQALAAVSVALPIVAISPAAETNLPKVLLKTNLTRLVFPPIDPTTIVRCIRIVTGRTCKDYLDQETAALMTVSDLILAIRFDRTPAECMSELRRLVACKGQPKSGRDVVIDDLHGMDEAVQWARELKTDLDAWRQGQLSWSSLSAGVCLVGPPGTGKTLFAQTLSTFLSGGSCRVPLIQCSLSQWQSADEAHLGHLLRAMRRDFEQAREKAPSVLFIDEIDSFADRSKVKHAHADYVVEVVNGLLAQLDGAVSREGIICVGASNDLNRCEPAILRPGRLGRIIRIHLPTEKELERMFRVRLRGQLATSDLSEICMLALGSTGAEVERIANDALRAARHAKRLVAVSDLRAAIVGTDDRTAADLEIAAVHEAGHVVSEIELFGNECDVHANIAAIGGRGGYTTRTKPPPFSGTYQNYTRRLQVLLAGRAREELLLSAACHGAGGRRGSDLQVAASMAAGMCASLGIAGKSKLLYLGDVGQTDELLAYPEVRMAANSELVKAERAVRALLSKHKVALREIASKLLKEKRIGGAAAAAIIRKHR